MRVVAFVIAAVVVVAVDGIRGASSVVGVVGAIVAIVAIAICVCEFDADKILISLERFVWKSNCASAVVINWKSQSANWECVDEKWLRLAKHSPTHVLSHSSRYQPRHSYSMSVFWQVHSARNGVPSIPKMANRQLFGLPAHFNVELSIAQACSYCSSRARHSGSSWHSSATVWHAGCVPVYTTPFDAFKSMVSGFFAHDGCIFSWARRHASLRCGDLLTIESNQNGH